MIEAYIRTVQQSVKRVEGALGPFVDAGGGRIGRDLTAVNPGNAAVAGDHQLLADHERLLGPNHPLTLTHRKNSRSVRGGRM